ncbi:MAG: DEAD/DEAH box helicase [Paenibacillaceae bacterium]
MIAQAALTIQGQWSDKKGIFIWGEHKNGSTCTAFELKIKLFSHHTASFYGHQLELGHWEKKNVVYLPVDTLFDYWAEPTPLHHARINWSEPLQVLQQAAAIMRIAVQQGNYMPDYSRWLTGTMGWKLHLDEPAAAAYELICQQWAQHGELFGLANVNVLFNLAIEQWIAKSPVLHELYKELASAYPILLNKKRNTDIHALARLCPDEDEFLQMVGWKQDTVPFHTRLQLAEPNEEDMNWRLQIMLQDQSNPEHYITCTVDGFPLDGSFPAGWEEHVYKRIHKMNSKWLNEVPELADSEQPEWIMRTLTHDQAWDFLTDQSLRLIEAGHTILLPAWWEQVRRTKPRLRAKLKSSVGSAKQSLVGLNQIVQFDWRLAVGDLDLGEAEFQELFKTKQRLVQLRGKWIMLDPVTLQQIQQNMKHVYKNKGLSFRDVLELHLLGGDEATGFAEEDNAINLKGEALVAPRFEIELNEHLRFMLQQLEQPTTLNVIDAPLGLNGILRKYQLEGTSWLLFLRRFGLGGCLADDMGLGKTIQWIAYILQLKETGLLTTAALLICPTSVIGNWQKELERFAPTLKVHLHYGSTRAKGETFEASLTDADVVITSYALSYMDEAELTTIHWSSLCLDEAQNIKNNYTKQATAIRGLQAEQRIALTGTPIENRLTELWSIFDFINPGYLSNLNEFRRKYVNIIERTGDAKQIQQVQKLVQPFLLRRLKKDPAIQLDLPDKNEMKTYVSLTKEQGALYEHVVQDVFKKIDQLSMMERRGLILATLTKLKQICNHPALFLKSEAFEVPDTAIRSHKLSRLLEMIQELRSEGDRCLIFTQYVEMGNYLQTYLTQQLEENIQFLHGGVPKAKRDTMIAQFQEPNNEALKGKPFNIFLLSLKAGGTGLNLTAANHVFHFDRWWNPAVENQATDRAFRIGQTLDVQVHKFITLGTIEERIDDMIEKKQSLNDQIVSGSESWITEMSNTDLKELFSLRREWIEN